MSREKALEILKNGTVIPAIPLTLDASVTSLKKSAAASRTARSSRLLRPAVLPAVVSPLPLLIPKLTMTTSPPSAV